MTREKTLDALAQYLCYVRAGDVKALTATPGAIDITQAKHLLDVIEPYIVERENEAMTMLLDRS